MNLPIGKLFFFVPKIQERDGNGHYAPYGMPGNEDAATAGYNTGTKNLYDRFYEANDSNDQGLFDYSKGSFTVVTGTVINMVTFSEGVASTQSAIVTGTSVSNVILEISGFTAVGAGKLAGPNGQEMDTEEFLASLQVQCSQVKAGDLPISIVTQKYGKGIVEYGSKSAGVTGQFNDICDANGIIYVNVDLQSYSATAGFSDYEVAGSTLAKTDFLVTYRQYASLEFEDELGEVAVPSFPVPAIPGKINKNRTEQLNG
jgi:hypothetical protein